MDVRFLDAKGVGRTLAALVRAHDDIRLSIAWATEGPHVDGLLEHAAKISRLVVGIEGYLTSPAFLEKIRRFRGARIGEAVNGVFHPKIYYFERQGKAAAIVGSANFTRGGTATNVEAALLIEGDKSVDVFVEIRAAIEAAFRSGRAIDTEFLQSYTLQHEATKGARDRLARPLVRLPTCGGKLAPLLTWSWADYAREVREADHHDPGASLQVLEAARALLAASPYNQLDAIERKAIAGTLPPSNALFAAGLSRRRRRKRFRLLRPRVPVPTVPARRFPFPARSPERRPHGGAVHRPATDPGRFSQPDPNRSSASRHRLLKVAGLLSLFGIADAVLGPLLNRVVRRRNSLR